MSSLSKQLEEKRKAKSVINPPDAAFPEPIVPYVPPQVAVEASPPAPAPAAPLASFVLYVDTASKKTPATVDLASVISEITPKILESLRKRSPQDVPEDAVDLREVKFGVGTQALCAYFRKNPPTGAVYASSVGLSGLVVEVLAPLAVDVIRPTR